MSGTCQIVSKKRIVLFSELKNTNLPSVLSLELVSNKI